MKKLSTIGAGHMGTAILEAAPFPPEQILVYEKNPAQSKKLQSKGYTLAASEQEAYLGAELVMLAAPPQAAPDIIAALAAAPKSHKPVIISIMAGIGSEYIRAQLDTPVITVMPTIGMTVGHGAAALAHTSDVPPDVLALVLDIFHKTGDAFQTEEESLKKIVAANGCSPGYAYYFIDAVANSVHAHGIDYEQAVRMAAHGFAGAALQILKSGRSPKELLGEVCTPGGLTAKGIEIFEAEEIAAAIAKGIKGSIDRGYELSQ